MQVGTTSVWHYKDFSPEATIQTDTMQRIAEQVTNVPTLPTVMTKVLELVDNPKTAAAQLAEFITNDQALTAKILKLANSAFYGFPQKIGTINLAIVVLGFQTVKDLGLSSAVVEVFSDDKYGRIFDLKRFWVHSIAVALGCQMIAEKRHPKIKDEIFVAGLLHDIGKLIICQHIPEEYDRVLVEMRTRNIYMFEAETELLTFNHADVGGWLTEKWNLPKHQAAAISYHIYPWLSVRQPNLAMFINFAEILSKHCGFGAIEDEPIPGAEPKMIDYLKLKLSDSGDVDWDYYTERLGNQMDRTGEFISVLLQTK